MKENHICEGERQKHKFMRVQTEKHSPFISIIMPVYNNENLLPNAVQSVMNQTFSDWELIIIDDGSTDMTPQVADALAASDQRITVIHQENQWIYKSFNNGYAAASGEYALIVNSDDTINPNSLQEIHDIAVIDHADIIMFNLVICVCGRNQKVLRYDLYNRANLLKEAFSYHDRDRIRKAWPSFIARYLIRHQCVYRKNIYKTYSYANKYFADDQFYNLLIADAVTAAAGTPYLVYNCFLYPNTEMNASVGKYYGYEHEMFDKYYLGYKRLFEKWCIFNAEIHGIIAADRLRGLSVEIRSYGSPQCPLPLEEKLKRIIEDSSDEIVYNCAAATNRIEEWESRILSGIRELFASQQPDPHSEYYFLYELLDSLLRYEKDETDYAKIRAAVYHPSNPRHVGQTFMRKLGIE